MTDAWASFMVERWCVWPKIDTIKIVNSLYKQSKVCSSCSILIIVLFIIYRFEYLFNFDNTFEIHDDIEVLKRMGMAYSLEKGQCDPLDVEKAKRMVPKALEAYVDGMCT